MVAWSGGVHVTDVWKSKEAFEAFATGPLASTVDAVGLPKPQIKFIEVDSFLTAG
jgi:hypothetical protein